MMEIIKLALKMILPFRDITFSTAVSEDKRDLGERPLSLSTVLKLDKLQESAKCSLLTC